MANMLDCNIMVSQFKLKSHYNINFQTNTLGKGINPTCYELNSTTTGLGIKYLTKVDMSLKKETKPKKYNFLSFTKFCKCVFI